MALVTAVLFSACSSQSDTLSEKLRLQLDVPQKVSEGSKMSLDLTLADSANDDLKFWLGHPIWDFVVARGDGSEVWRWSNGKFGDLVERQRSLGAQGLLKCGYLWDMKDNQGQAIPSGRYIATGVFRLYSKPYEADDPPTPETVTSTATPFMIVPDEAEVSRSPNECDPPLIGITELPKPTQTPTP